MKEVLEVKGKDHYSVTDGLPQTGSRDEYLYEIKTPTVPEHFTGNYCHLKHQKFIWQLPEM